MVVLVKVWAYSILFLVTFKCRSAQELIPVEVEGSGEGSGEADKNANDFDFKLQPDPSCFPKLDLAVLLDASGSMSENFARQVEWVIGLLQKLPISPQEVRAAVIQFTGYAYTEFALNTYSNKRDILNHVRNIRYRSGVTRTGGALRRARAELFRIQRGARPEAKKVIVLFTDGLSIDNPLPIAKEMREHEEVIIYTVAVANNPYMPELEGMAGDKENVFYPKDLDRLEAKLLRNVEQSRTCGKKDNHLDKLPIIQPLDEEDEENIVKKIHKPLDRTNLPTSSSVATSSTPVKSSAATVSHEQMQSDQPTVTHTSGSSKAFPTEDSTKLTTPEVTKTTPVTETKTTLLFSKPTTVTFTTQYTTENSTSEAINTSTTEESTTTTQEEATLTPTVPLNDEEVTVTPELIFDDNETGFITTTISSVGHFSADTTATINVTLTTIIQKLKPSGEEQTKVVKPNKAVKQSNTDGVEEALSNAEESNFTSQIANERQPQSGREQTREACAFLFSHDSSSDAQTNYFNCLNEIPRKIVQESEEEVSVTPSIKFIQEDEETIAFGDSVKSEEIDLENTKEEKQNISIVENSTIGLATSVPHRFNEITLPPRNENDFKFDNLRLPVVEEVEEVIQQPSQFLRRSKDGDCEAQFFIILDSSGSVQNSFELQRNFVKDIIESISVNAEMHRVALMQFAGKHVQKMEFVFDTYHSKLALLGAVNRIRHVTGTTYLGLALKRAEEELRRRRRQSQTIVLIVSDGYTQDDALIPATRIRDLPGVTVYSVALSNPAYRRYLQQISGTPGRTYVGLGEAELFKQQIQTHAYCTGLFRR